MVPQTWKIECQKMYEISNKISNFITNTMENWTVKLITGGQTLAEVKIQSGIFHVDSFLLLLFIFAMMPLN